MNKIVVGIDIGGTNTVFGFVTEKGDVLYQNTIPTQTHEAVEDYVAELADHIKKGKESLKEESEIVGMGIGAPNGNYYTGNIENAPNLRWKGIIKFTEIFKSHFDFPIHLTNDANAASIGEMVFGGAKYMNDFIVVTLGTGLGSGIVINGKVLYGHDGFAGELGHVESVPNGRQCGCGGRGCLETYVSATGVARTATQILSERMDESDLRKIPNDELTSKMVSEAAAKGDAIAIETYNYTTQMLGNALADYVKIASPEAVFLFGGLTKAGDILFEQTKAQMEKKLMPIFQNKVKILPSQLDDNAAIMGASALAWYEIHNDKK